MPETRPPLVESNYVLEFANKKQTPITVRIGKPYRASAKSWACAVAMQGLLKSMTDVEGQDALQALCLALSVVRQVLEHFVNDGGRVLLPGTGTSVPLASTFGTVGGDEA
jgi:hypothetical protein